MKKSTSLMAMAMMTCIIFLEFIWFLKLISSYKFRNNFMKLIVLKLKLY